MSILGQTLPEIAWHKAGIFKPGCPAITVPGQPPDAMEVLVKQADKISAPLYIAPALSDYPTDTTLKLGLDGDVQCLNATLALQLCRTWIARRGTRIEGKLIDRLIDWSIDWCIYLFIEWVIDWLSPLFDSFSRTCHAQKSSG